MAIVPKPGFPLRESDQADVIRMFIELMRGRDGAACASEAAIKSKPIAPRSDSKNPEIPRELLDLD
jgi:hypothetical protein